VAGDFNLPADSAIFRDNWSWLQDAFGQAGWGYGYSKYTKYWGIRIDHVLTGPGWQARSCQVQSDVGSDHLPPFTQLEYSAVR
jgi:endonuclease/exonuclease/phosphatase (EEP) superfamily protein YafD